mmetsp:Transcript_3742/g.11619  ORF Transcript_3742/g.11619 Transcript_3742/m.11619 type:complete len:84 (-) Transcript_3742:356-607(-)
MSSLSRRQVRLRREYLYRRSLEGAEKETYEKKRRVAEALAERPVRRRALRLDRRLLELLSEAFDRRRLVELVEVVLGEVAVVV